MALSCTSLCESAHEYATKCNVFFFFAHLIRGIFSAFWNNFHCFQRFHFTKCSAAVALRRRNEEFAIYESKKNGKSHVESDWNVKCANVAPTDVSVLAHLKHQSVNHLSHTFHKLWIIWTSIRYIGNWLLYSYGRINYFISIILLAIEWKVHIKGASMTKPEEYYISVQV